jgi:hypothetical protein
MSVIGVDFGATGLRFATIGDGSAPRLLQREYGRLPYLTSTQRTADGIRLQSITFNSIKRIFATGNPESVLWPGLTTQELLVAVLKHPTVNSTSAEFNRCVVAVPPGFSERARSAVRSAGIQAGMPDTRLIDDTTAVLVASEIRPDRLQSVLVVSWGGS